MAADGPCGVTGRAVVCRVRRAPELGSDSAKPRAAMVKTERWNLALTCSTVQVGGARSRSPNCLSVQVGAPLDIANCDVHQCIPSFNVYRPSTYTDQC